MFIAIVGSAGRRSDAQYMSRTLYERIVRDCEQQINQLSKSEEIHLISGGAALADHVAISLYLMDFVDSLTLYLPARWSSVDCKYHTSQDGNVANYYHQQFSRAICGNASRTLQGIQKAIDKGAAIDTSNLGFLNRNKAIAANCDAAIAYTFYNGKEPKPKSGTRHTWDRIPDSKIKIHRNLFELIEKK